MKVLAENQKPNSPTLRLNVDKINELRRAYGISTDAELARRIGIDPATLYRYTTGSGRPSNQVLARIKAAFPLVALDDLVKLEVAA